MLDGRSRRRFASATLALLLVAAAVGVGGVESAAADADFAVTTEPATNVTETGATLRGNLTGLGGADSATVYVAYWKAGSKDSTQTWWTGDSTSTAKSFGADVALEAGTTYRYRAYARSAAGTWKAGSVREVTTEGRRFGVETGESTDVTASSAAVRGNITGLGGADSATVYVKYWPEGDAGSAYWWSGESKSSPGAFSADLGLAPGTTYRYRALARSADGTWTEGAVRRVTTPDSGFGVTTAPAESVGTESATVGGNLTSLGGTDSATVYVKYWREGLKPSTTYWWTGDARSSPGSFAASLDLRAGTEYEYRAFARSSDGRWKAGAVESFATAGNAYEVSTPFPENVTHDSAEVAAELHGLGGADSATVYLRYWEKGRQSQTTTWWTGPTVSEPGTYGTTLIDLKPETTYTVQALAKDAAGNWKVSSVKGFTTEAEPASGEPPDAFFDTLLKSPGDDFRNAKPLDSADAVTFNASESHDPDGEVVSYEWDFDNDGTTDATGEVVTHSFPAAGDYPVELTVTDDAGNVRRVEHAVHVGGKVADTIYAVNAGGPDIYAGTDHPDWVADMASNPSPYANHDASGSRVLEADSDISGFYTNEPPSAPNHMWETVREDPADGEPMRYSFDVESGRTYEVHVFFTEVEIDQSAYEQGQRRIFDVTVDGRTLVNDLDTYGELGHDTGESRTVTVTADDGTLTVEFHRERGDPVVSGIEILRIGEDESS